MLTVWIGPTVLSNAVAAEDVEEVSVPVEAAEVQHV